MSVMLYHCIVCVSLLIDLLVLCVASLTLDSVCQWFGKTIHSMFGCGYYFVVECNGSV